ncbi:hypothetical protein [Terrabacter terrae]
MRADVARQRSERSKTSRLSWGLAWLTLLPLASLRAGLLAETDTFWQIRTGLVTLANHAIPRVDPFSWTARGEPWTLNSWGFNLIVAMAYRLAGLPGVALTCAAFIMLSVALAFLLAKRLGSTPWIAAATLFVVAPVLIAWFSARPQLLDYVAVLVLALVLRRLVDGRAPTACVLSVGAVAIMWVNLHSASLLGVAIVGGAAALMLARRSTRRRGYTCLAAAAAALAGSLVNPYGVGVFAQTAGVKSASTDVVTEWQHADLTSFTQVVMLLLGLAALAIAVRRQDPVFTSALGVTFVGSVVAIRILPMLVLLAVPVIAAALSVPAVVDYARRMRLVLVPGATIAVVALAAAAVPSLGHLGQPDAALYPTDVVRQIPLGCRLFNSYQIGGFVMLERPDVPVAMDSRNDLYGADRVVENDRLVRGQGDLEAGLAGAGCVLVPPSSGMAKRLQGDPRWRLRTSEPAGALYVRA